MRVRFAEFQEPVCASAAVVRALMKAGYTVASVLTPAQCRRINKR